MSASEEVAQILYRRRWNAKRLAVEAGVAPSTVTRILRNEKSPMHATMERLRAAGKRKKAVL